MFGHMMKSFDFCRKNLRKYFATIIIANRMEMLIRCKSVEFICFCFNFV